MVERGKFTPLKDEFAPRRKDRDVELQAVFNERVTLASFYPGMHPDIIDALVEKGYKGVIIAGTGLGHVN